MEYLQSLSTLLLLIFMVQPKGSDGLANSTYYIIQNVASKHCLTASGPDSNESNTITLFKHGHISSRECANLTDGDDTHRDLSQQWMLRLLPKGAGQNNYPVQLAMQNSNITDHRLNATLRGEFITYLPPSLDLDNTGSGGEVTGSLVEGYRVLDPSSSKCLTDDYESNVVQFEECVGGGHKENSNRSGDDDGTKARFQTWTFSIVNEKELIHHQVEALRANSTQFH